MQYKKWLESNGIIVWKRNWYWVAEDENGNIIAVELTKSLLEKDLKELKKSEDAS